MNWLLLAVKLIPTILQLMGLAERVFADKPGSGAEKKALVMDATKALAEGADAIFTGGAGETWARIKEPVSTIVDAASTIAFPKTGQGYSGPQ